MNRRYLSKGNAWAGKRHHKHKLWSEYKTNTTMVRGKQKLSMIWAQYENELNTINKKPKLRISWTPPENVVL